jgi:hypothetical protein
MKRLVNFWHGTRLGQPRRAGGLGLLLLLAAAGPRPRRPSASAGSPTGRGWRSSGRNSLPSRGGTFEDDFAAHAVHLDRIGP